MNKSSMSSSLVKFWRYMSLSMVFLMVIILYIIAPQGPLPACLNKAPTPQTCVTKELEAALNTEEPKRYVLSKEEGHYRDIAAPTCHELSQKFAEHGYNLTKNTDTNDYAVARVYLTSFPKDFSRLDYGQKKTLFLKSLLPLILETNEKITAERKKLTEIIRLRRAGVKLSFSHNKWLSNLAVKYRLKKMCLNELYHRVDTIPASLALSQAITETGWGTSHAAKEKKSPFGFMAANRVISYKTLRHSVEAYIQTLNSHPAYKPLRTIRAGMRKSSQELCGIELAKGLKNYSTRGQAYITEIQQVIRDNNLKQFDSARLISVL